MRVLVTGGAGFIGSHVVDQLVEQGASVTVLDNFITGRRDNLAGVADKVAIEEVDLRQDDISAILRAGRFDTIVHAAGNANIALSVGDPRRDLGDNVLATQALLEAVRHNSPNSAIVNISSATVYAEGNGDPMPEEYPKDPASPYGTSKFAAELYVSLYARLYGLRTSSVRVFSVFGPRLRKQVVWDFMTRLAENPSELTVHGDGTEQRNPTHVANIAKAILLVAELSPMTGNVFNIGSKDSISIGQLARDIADTMGKSPVIQYTGQRGAGHSQAWRADIGRLESLGYVELTGYRDGLVETHEWFRSLAPATSR